MYLILKFCHAGRFIHVSQNCNVRLCSVSPVHAVQCAANNLYSKQAYSSVDLSPAVS
jgi:hypothetical protein